MTKKLTPKTLEAFLNKAAKEIANPTAAIQKVTLVVEGRAKQKAPVRTGTLRRSISSRVVSPMEGAVGSNLEYATYVHDGTKYMEGRPFIEEAIQESMGDIERA